MGIKITRDSKTRKKVRVFRIKKRLFGTSDRPRLLFSKTLRFLYAQLIDDVNRKTLFSFSTFSSNEIKEINKKEQKYNLKNKKIALLFGKKVGDKLKEKGYNSIVFDRNGYVYHGKVKVFADAVREQGVNF